MMIFVILITTIFAIWMGYFVIQVRYFDLLLFAWNDNEWHLNKLAKPAFLVRFINVGAFGGGSLIFYIIQKTFVTPALKKKLKIDGTSRS